MATRPDTQAGRSGLGNPVHAMGNWAVEFARRLGRGVATWGERRQLAYELESLDDSALADLGIGRSQIPSFVKGYAGADELLAKMLAHLGLEDASVKFDRLLSRNLYSNCTLCNEQKRCRHWLDSEKEGKAAPAFCPNVWYFQKILSRERERAANRTAGAA